MEYAAGGEVNEGPDKKYTGTQNKTKTKNGQKDKRGIVRENKKTFVVIFYARKVLFIAVLPATQDVSKHTNYKTTTSRNNHAATTRSKSVRRRADTVRPACAFFFFS